MFFHHILAYGERLYLIVPEPLSFLGHFFKICVPMFFIVSAYGLTLSVTSFKSQFKRIYIFLLLYQVHFLPLVIITLLYYYYFDPEIIFNVNNSFDFSFLNFIKSLFLLDFSYLPEGWFGQNYIIYLIAFPFLIQVRSLYLLIISILSFFLSFIIKFEFFLNLNSIFYWLPSLISGILIARHWNYVKNIIIRGYPNINLIGYYVVITFLLAIVFYFYGKNSLQIIAPFISVFVMETSPFKRFFNWLGGFSLSFWLVHPFIIYYLFSEFFYGESLFFCMSFGFLLSVFLAYVFNLITNKIIRGFYGRA